MGVGDTGWEPVWRRGEDQIARHQNRLASRLGRLVLETWVVWDTEDDRWLGDFPVLIRFDDGHQLEMCWQHQDELALTWDSIDVEAGPWPWPGAPVEWRPSGHRVLAALEGELVLGIAATEQRDPSHGWCTSGLWFGTSGAGAWIHSNRDANGLAARAPGPGPHERLAWLDAVC